MDTAERARRYMSIWRDPEPDLRALAGRDILVRMPMTPDLHGVHELAAHLREMHEAFSEISLDLDDVIAAGDRAAVRSTWQGVHVGDFHGIPATGHTLTVTRVDLLRFAGDLVVEDLAHADVYAMFVQLGVLPWPDHLVRAPVVSASFH